jgi:Raf kinase inhibitor-like YbhB/YbcL family protein
MQDVGMFSLQSPAFEDGQEMDRRYGKLGQNVSPPLTWSDAPSGTKSFALAVVDRHPVARNYVHWLVAHLDSDQTLLPEGAGGSDAGGGLQEVQPYVGPFPPSGVHDYEFTLYALRTGRLALSADPTLEQFEQAAQQESLATARLIGMFRK